MRPVSILMVAACCALWPSLANAQVSCADWNTLKFFENATAEDVVRCIARAVDPAARDVNGMTPLHAAAGRSETPAVIAALLDAGADLQARALDGLTPLHAAAGLSKFVLC